MPETALPLDALTADDEANLPFVAEHADIVAISFVRTAADIEHVLGCLAAAGATHLGPVLKIETREAFEYLLSIVLTAMRHPRLGVMIARGALAVELGFERLSEVPRQILALCEAAHVPALWTTQVLGTLAKTGQPSRRNHRRGGGAACRMRDAQQGSEHARRHQSVGRHSRPHG